MLDRIVQACTERRKIIAEELPEVADTRRRELRLRRNDAPVDVVDQGDPQRGPTLGIERIGPRDGGFVAPFPSLDDRLPRREEVVRHEAAHDPLSVYKR